jgi:hypothetical protein
MSMMKRAAMMMAMSMALLVSAGITRAAAKEKTMTAVGNVKTVKADSLAINDGAGKDWIFVIDSKTKVTSKAETIDVPPTTNLNKVTPQKREITDAKEGERVQVKYRVVNGKNLATQVQIN